MGDSKHDRYDWVKLALDNKLLIFAFLSFLGSAAGNVSQAFDINKKDKDLKTMGESYATIVYQKMKIEPEKQPAKPTTKTVYINHCADECKKIMADHIKEFH